MGRIELFENHQYGIEMLTINYAQKKKKEKVKDFKIVRGVFNKFPDFFGTGI